MEDTKILAFVGNPCHDFIIYLSGVMQKLSKSVLVIDATKTQSIMNCIPKPREQFGLIRYRDVDYMSIEYKNKEERGGCEENDKRFTHDEENIFLKKESREKVEKNKRLKEEEGRILLEKVSREKEGQIKFNQYNIVLIFYDKDTFSTTYQETKCDEIFVITDLHKQNILNTAEFIEKISSPIHLIYRDVCDCKINPQYCSKTFFSNQKNIRNQYVIKLDQSDYEYRLLMEYEPYQEFKYLSDTYQICIKEIIMYLLQLSKKEMNKAFYLSKKGGFI